jgi:hypothetical protein
VLHCNVSLDTMKSTHIVSVPLSLSLSPSLSPSLPLSPLSEDRARTTGKDFE